MQRYLNTLNAIEIELVDGKSKRYQTVEGGDIPDDKELFLGLVGGEVVGVFYYKSGQIYSLSFDDFSYDFLSEENAELNAAYSALISALPTGTVPTMPDEDGVS